MSNLDRAIELVRKAIDEDVKHNYPEAYKYYKDSLDYFMLALKYEKNEKSKLLMRSKIVEYLGRAETLKEHLAKESLKGPGAVISHNNFLQRAIELVEKAIDEDGKYNYPEAYKYYQNSLDYFMLAMKYEKNEKSKLLIKSKTVGYLSRAEILKEHLMTEKRGGVNGRGGAADPTGKSKDGDEGPETRR